MKIIHYVSLKNVKPHAGKIQSTIPDNNPKFHNCLVFSQMLTNILQGLFYKHWKLDLFNEIVNMLSFCRGTLIRNFGFFPN